MGLGGVAVFLRRLAVGLRTGSAVRCRHLPNARRSGGGRRHPLVGACISRSLSSTIQHGGSDEGAAILKIGIPRETYNPWERRAPLTPSQMQQLIQETDGKLAFTVQPSARRIFKDIEYVHAGATLMADEDDHDFDDSVDIIMGVKRTLSVHPNKTYLVFSHTIKGQPENMSLLKECLDKNVQLIDYERITADSGPRQNKRLVSFGHFAGIAGTMDSFHALGRKLLFAHGASTPFLSFPPSIMHDSLEDSRKRVLRMGERILHDGLEFPEPLVYAVTGKGGCVHRGAMEILNMLPHEAVSVADLPQLFEEKHRGPQYKVHLVQIDLEDVFQRRTIVDGKPFDREDYKLHPTEYRSLFARRVAPYSHVIVNTAYWDARFPRLLTKRQMKRIAEDGNNRLMVVADISCDVHGSIEFLERTTTIENSCFQYDPIAGHEVETDLRSGVTVMGVDILPTELPKESSDHFGNALTGVVKQLLAARKKQDKNVQGIDPSLLSAGLGDACITTIDGSLTPGFQYLKTLMKQATKHTKHENVTMTLSLDGHLFDSGLINQILDVVEQYGSGLQFKECIFPPPSGMKSSKSQVVLKIDCNDETSLSRIETKIQSLVDVIEKAQASMVRIDRPQNGEVEATTSMVSLENQKLEKRVLLLGAGRVSKSFVHYLGRSGDVVITVASDNDDDARGVAKAASKGRHVAIDVDADLQQLSSLIEEADLVVSFLPAPMHPAVGMECIVHNTDLVTASYESDEMRGMAARISDAGITFLNEVGLDPGLDHMSAMKIIDDIKARGGEVTCFSSVCGGLPHPDYADNPLGYKFSWSPKGVIRASQNGARYRWNGTVKEIHGRQLLQSAFPFDDAWNDLELECLPNRDSLIYEKVYGIAGADTIFRGTLRYSGFSEVMDVFQNLGLFESFKSEASTWQGLIDLLRAKRGGFDSVHDFVLACSDENLDKANRAYATLKWLDLLGQKAVISSAPVVDNFSDALEQKLVYEEGERDMVLMHHSIMAAFANGTREKHHSSLQVVGDESLSAMSKTVGFTAAASAQLLLSGSLQQATGSGLLLPTNPAVYVPVLSSLELEGIEFSESIITEPPGTESQTTEGRQ